MTAWRNWFKGVLRNEPAQFAQLTAGQQTPAMCDAGSRVAALAAELQELAPERAESLLTLMCAGLRADVADEARYRVAESLAAVVYPKYKFSEYGRLFLEDEEFLSYYERFMDPENWHSLDRKYVLDQLLKLVVHLAGDFAECGAYKGFSAYRMCLALRGTGRLVHLFDSFEGLSAPDRCDGNYWTAGALRIPERALHETLAEFDNYRCYAGWIPERFCDVADREFCFLHVDVDLYRPTLDSLAFFYSRIAAGGLILLDDYGFKTCPGAKRAADEFFAERPEAIVMLPTGQAFVVKR
jgi:O-methyltransferase